MRHYLPFLFFFFALFSIYGQQSYIELSPTSDEIFLNKNVYICANTCSSATINSLLTEKAFSFIPSSSIVPNFGRAGGVHWARFNVRSPSTKRWILEIDFPYIDNLQLFLVKDQTQLVDQWGPMGWQLSSDKRHINHRNYITALELQANINYTIYIRASNKVGLLKLPMTLWDEQRFYQADDQRMIAWGWFGGIMFFMSLFGLFLYLTFQDPTYLYFALYTLGFMYLMYLMEGIVRYFFPIGPDWLTGSEARPLFSILTVAALLKFSQLYLSIGSQTHPRVYVLIHYAMYATLALLISIYFYLFYHISNHLLLQIGNTLIILIVLSIVLLVIWRIIQGYKPALFYLVAILPFVVIGIGQTLLSYNMISHSTLFFEGLPFAVVCKVFVLCMGLIYRFKIYKNKNENLLHEINKEQQRTYEAILKGKEEEGKRMQEELRALEIQTLYQSERERIARDLHDNVGSQLTFIISNLDYIAHHSEYIHEKDSLKPSLEEVGNQARETMHLLRDTMWAVHKESITAEELVKRLQYYINQRFRYNEKPVCQLTFLLHKNPLLKPGDALNLFRIVQEALNNILKHAQASVIQIYVSISTTNELILQIGDNGVGFSIHASAVAQEKFGLQNMQKRAESIGARFELQSAFNQGTTVSVTMTV
ncbi:sensor histidine kinase [Xanthocytophaga flava]|uniref:sensor histidine kinase n=1 Tax=Xanthocytophaga flava TaxID=3048013 RepID=UPI0028D463D7|nr:7TM-DISM domain-containing protein [Xanthocytophaga flavus]MDJ1469038.1 7TM-DISM domain-containing protein [Xanthocytophaga flavus]